MSADLSEEKVRRRRDAAVRSHLQQSRERLLLQRRRLPNPHMQTTTAIARFSGKRIIRDTARCSLAPLLLRWLIAPVTPLSLSLSYPQQLK